MVLPETAEVGKTSTKSASTCTPKKVAVPNGGTLSCMPGFFKIIGGFVLQLTKSLLKLVFVLFYGKSDIFKFIRALLSMRVISTHYSLKVPPFGAVPIYSTFFRALIKRQAEAKRRTGEE